MRLWRLLHLGVLSIFRRRSRAARAGNKTGVVMSAQGLPAKGTEITNRLSPMRGPTRGHPSNVNILNLKLLAEFVFAFLRSKTSEDVGFPNRRAKAMDKSGGGVDHGVKIA